MSSSSTFSIWVINKAGGLIFSKNYAEGLSPLTSNDYLILASTFHSIHAIASRISPVPYSSGVESIEAETFKMTCLQTPTGTKFVLLTTPSHPNAEGVLKRVYECYADYMKDPFYTTEMPIRSEGFEKRLEAVIRAGEDRHEGTRWLEGGEGALRAEPWQQVLHCIVATLLLRPLL